MPIQADPDGTLDIENATLRSRGIVALTNMVAGNDVVRSGGPALEVYGDPGPRLELVSNTAATDGTATFTRLESNVGVFSIQSGEDASTNGPITFGGFANERMRITGNGNVGIGTADPGTALTVFSTSGTQMTLRSDSRYSTIFAVDDTGSSFFGNDRGAIRFSTGGDTSGSGSSEKMRILANGNVGIGTTTPAYPLHIQTTGDGDSVFNFVTDQRNDVNVYYRKIAYVNNNNGHVTIRGSMGSHSKSAGNGFIDIKFSVRDGFTALGSCYGTISNTNIIVKDNTINNRKDIYLVTGSYSLANLQITTTHGCGIFGDNENQPTSTAPSGTTTHDLKENFTTFRVDDDGNVGIGTTNPNNKLHVETAPGVNTNLVKIASSVNSGSSQSVSGIEFATNPAFYNGDNGQRTPGQITSGFYQGGAADWNDAYISLRTPTNAGSGTINDVLTIRGGLVGIGTNNPVAKLIVNAYGGPSSTDCLIIGANTTSQNLRIGVDSTDEFCWIQSHSGKPLRLNPDGNQVQYGTSDTVLSDDRIKVNEVYIENATDTLLKLKPQIYDKKLIWNISKLGETSNTSIVREGGLITQDVWYDTPELRHLVHLGEGAEPGDDKPYTDNDPTNDPDYSSWGDNVSLLDYNGLIPYLIKSNQELHARIQALENAS